VTLAYVHHVTLDTFLPERVDSFFERHRCRNIDLKGVELVTIIFFKFSITPLQEQTVLLCPFNPEPNHGWNFQRRVNAETDAQAAG
jgi:hypothetical protein